MGAVYRLLSGPSLGSQQQVRATRKDATHHALTIDIQLIAGIISNTSRLTFPALTHLYIIFLAHVHLGDCLPAGR